MSTSKILGQELKPDGILRITLDDEMRRNALSEEMLEMLTNAIDDASKSNAIRVVIIAAKGPAFSAGHDLKQLTAARQNADFGETYFAKIMDMCAFMMQSIVNCPKPVIAEVNGVATAAGCQLVASCDLAFASTTSKFSTPGVNIGLFCSTPMVALSRNISNKHAMEMLLTGDMILAKRAAEIGLINSAVDAEDLEATTMRTAQKIASKSSLTLAIGKKAFYAQKEKSLSEAYEYTSQVMTQNMLAQDAKEGIEAFIEKRNPVWRDQ